MSGQGRRIKVLKSDHTSKRNLPHGGKLSREAPLGAKYW
jgi:hypothetical protein